MKSKSDHADWIVLGLALVPPCLLSWLILRFWVDLPQWDQWGYVPFFEKFSRSALTFGDLFGQVNEFRQFFPNLVFVALGWLTRWDVRYEMLVTFLLACLVASNVYHLAERTIEDNRSLRLWLILIANLIIFSPAQYQNWLQGQQLVYLFPIACVTTCLRVAASGWNLKTKFALCAGLSVISTFSSANGILCWLVVLPVLMLAGPRQGHTGRRWLLGAWVAGLFLSAALYLFHYHKPVSTPSPFAALSQPLHAIIYFFGFLGAPLALERGKVAAVVGLVLFFIFGVSCINLFQHRRDPALVLRMTIWLMIGWYSVLTAIMTTVGRVGFGVGQSQNTRYLGFSAYLIVALVFLVTIITQNLSLRRPGSTMAIQIRRMAFLSAGALILLQPFILISSVQRMAVMRRTLRQAKALLLFINLKEDPELVKVLYPDRTFLTKEANELNQLGFLRPALIKTSRVEEFATSPNSKPTDYGSWDRFTWMDQNQFRASGRLTFPYHRDLADAILLAYKTADSDTVMFRIVRPQERPAGLWGYDTQAGQWEVSFSAGELPAQPVTLSAWGFDADTGKAFRLKGSFEVPESEVQRHAQLKSPE